MSATSGYVISLRERKDVQGNPLYCTPPDDRNGWTTYMPKDTVAFEYTEGRSWGGSVGLTRNGKRWQQLVHIADGYTLSGDMHVLGHVLDESDSTCSFLTLMKTRRAREEMI